MRRAINPPTVHDWLEDSCFNDIRIEFSKLKITDISSNVDVGTGNEIEINEAAVIRENIDFVSKDNGIKKKVERKKRVLRSNISSSKDNVIKKKVERKERVLRSNISINADVGTCNEIEIHQATVITENTDIVSKAKIIKEKEESKESLKIKYCPWDCKSYSPTKFTCIGDEKHALDAIDNMQKICLAGMRGNFQLSVFLYKPSCKNLITKYQQSYLYQRYMYLSHFMKVASSKYPEPVSILDCYSQTISDIEYVPQPLVAIKTVGL